MVKITELSKGETFYLIGEDLDEHKHQMQVTVTGKENSGLVPIVFYNGDIGSMLSSSKVSLTKVF